MRVTVHPSDGINHERTEIEYFMTKMGYFGASKEIARARIGCVQNEQQAIETWEKIKELHKKCKLCKGQIDHYGEEEQDCPLFILKVNDSQSGYGKLKAACKAIGIKKADIKTIETKEKIANRMLTKVENDMRISMLACKITGDTFIRDFA